MTGGGDSEDSWSSQLLRRLQSVEQESLLLPARRANNIWLECRALNHWKVGGGETAGHVDQLSGSGHAGQLGLARGLGVQLPWFEHLDRDLVVGVSIIVTINVVVYLGDRQATIIC